MGNTSVAVNVPITDYNGSLIETSFNTSMDYKMTDWPSQKNRNVVIAKNLLQLVVFLVDFLRVKTISFKKDRKLKSF